MNHSYQIQNPELQSQAGIFNDLHMVVADALYEYGMAVSRGKGLFFTTTVNSDIITDIIRKHLAEFDIHEIDQSILDFVHDYGTLVYVDVTGEQIHPLMWAAGAYSFESVNKIALDVLELDWTNVLDYPTWDVGMSSRIPHRYIRSGRLKSFLNHRKSTRQFRDKLLHCEAMYGQEIQVNEYPFVWSCNVGKVLRKLRRKNIAHHHVNGPDCQQES